jgi:hypothetical protein
MFYSHGHLNKFKGFLFFLILSFWGHSLEAQWARVYGKVGVDELYSICQTTSGDFIAVGSGYASSSRSDYLLVLKIIQKGNFRWRLGFQGHKDSEARVVVAAPDDGCVIAGSASTQWGRDSDIWLLRLDKRGDTVWEQMIGSSEVEKAYALAESNYGGYVVAGEQDSHAMAFELSPKGKIKWKKRYIPENSSSSVAETIASTSDGGFIFAGHVWYAGYSDIWVCKLARWGGIEWQNNYRLAGAGYAFSSMELPDGNYVVGCNLGSNREIAILNLDAEGKVIGTKTYKGSGGEKGYSLKTTFDGGYIMTGESTSSESTEPDILVMKLSPEGNIQWQKVYGGFYQSDSGYCVGQTMEGGYVLAGYTRCWGAGESDGIILKLYPNGDISPLSSFISQADLHSSDTNLNRHDINTRIHKANIDLKNVNTYRYKHNGDKYALGRNPTHKLILKSGSGGTTDPPPGTYFYPDGTIVTLKAAPYAGYDHARWEGHISLGYGKQTAIFPMDGNKTITAKFQEEGEWSGGGGGGAGSVKISLFPETRSVVALGIGFILLFILLLWLLSKIAHLYPDRSA